MFRQLTIFAAMLLGGCSLTSVSDSVQTLSATKQKQRINMLQKKLEIAEKTFHEAEGELEKLQKALHDSQLALIAKQIEAYRGGEARKKVRPAVEDPPLFLEEREVLQKMMEEGPSQQALEAQVVLDKILRLITEAKDAR
jgi:hypothetical protein